MKNLTKEQLFEIISKPQPEDGFEAVVKMHWKNNNAKGIFELTGLDVSHLLEGKEKPIFEFQKPKNSIRFVH